jgi:signal transduction histidine kinase
MAGARADRYPEAAHHGPPQAVKSYHRAMLAAGYLTLRSVPGTAASASAGPAVTTLTAVATRTAAAVRCVALGYIAVQVAIWHTFYAADPRRLAGPALAAAGIVALMCWLRWRRAGWRLAVADSALQVALALGATWCLPPAMHGDTASWLYIAVASQLPVSAWFAPGAVSAPLALASAGAYWAGAASTPAASSPAAAVAMLLGIYIVAWRGLRMMSRRAVAADAGLARADQESRAQFVALSRAAERREHERLLHDTVLNTLTALARPPGGAGHVLARCRDEVALMEAMLGGADDLDEPAGSPGGGLLAGLDAVAADMRARGLAVHVDADPRLPAACVPGPVAAALARAVREALANVASHAGTGEAWVQASLTGPPPAALQVTVRDEGAGFDPAGVGTDRLGLRRSIIERVADWDGRASVTSAPGAGTVVTLYWPGALPGPADDGAADRGGRGYLPRNLPAGPRSGASRWRPEARQDRAGQDRGWRPW